MGVHVRYVLLIKWMCSWEHWATNTTHLPHKHIPCDVERCHDHFGARSGLPQLP